MLPPLDEHGVLPPGDYELTLEQLRESMLVIGSGACTPSWDASWRALLVDNLEVMVRRLWEVGIGEIYIDGSFAEDKDHPNDIDGYFVCDQAMLTSGMLERELDRIDPYKVWTWDPDSRRPIRGSVKAQLRMWHRYRVELYPHYGQVCGIKDPFGHDLTFPSAFRTSRRVGRPRGIIRIGGPT